jgi:hypothetical protein
MKHDLELKIAEFIRERVHVTPIDRIGDLIRFLDRVGRDRREILLQIPRAAMLRIAETAHDLDETFQIHRDKLEGDTRDPVVRSFWKV